MSIHAIHGYISVFTSASTLFKKIPRHHASNPIWRISPGAFAGGALLSISALIAFVNSGNTWFVFAMSGDSANNILLQVEQQVVNGVRPGVSTYAVPMSPSLLQLTSIPDAINASSQDLLSGYAITWLVSTVIGSILVGAYLSGYVDKSRRGARILAACIGSLIPLIWFYSGYAIDYGFFNTQIVLLTSTAFFILYKSKYLSIVDKLTYIVLTSTLLLATWSPLVLLTVGYGLFLIRPRLLKQTFSEQTSKKVFLIFAMLSFASYATFYVLPNLLQNSAVLRAPGAIFPVRLELYIFIAVVLIVASIVASKFS
jgi:hypothetical protein